MSIPRVSVVMPARDSERFIDDAIASVLAQDLADIELIVLDDGSSDATRARIEDWAQRDVRVKPMYRDCPPLGLVGSSQEIVMAASAPLVARLDADDVARRDRLANQVRVMDADPDCVLVGSLARGIDAGGRVVRPRDLARLLPAYGAVPTPHSSWMFRRKAFISVGGYPQNSEGWEDKALFHLLGHRGRIAILPDALVDIRFHRAGTTVGYNKLERARLLEIERRFTGIGDVDTVRADAYRLHSGLRVWAGERPNLRPDMPAWGTSKWFTRSVHVALYATAGAVAPRVLRAWLRAGISVRNRTLRHRFPKGVPVVYG